jgi:hypothetical protein
VSGVAAVGASTEVGGFVLAGVTVLPTDDDGPEAAFARLPPDTELLLLDAGAAAVLADRLRERPRLLWVVLP